MAQQPSQAQFLHNEWLDFRSSGSLMYDVLLWQNMSWPALSLAWLPKANWTPPDDVLAAQEASAQRRRRQHISIESGLASASNTVAERHPSSPTSHHHHHHHHQGSRQDKEVDSGARSAERNDAATHQTRQTVPMPVQYHYLLAGTQTSGKSTAFVDLYRVEVPGEVSALEHHQKVLMQPGTMQQVMRISHGVLDVNRLAVMPQQPSIIATSSDVPQVYLFDLRHHSVQEWDLAAGRRSHTETDGPGTEKDAGSISDGVSDVDSSNGSSGEDQSESGASGCSANPSGAPAHHSAVLAGRSAGGFGLEFNPVKAGLLLGADLEGGVQLWDVEHLQHTKGSPQGSTPASGTCSPRQGVSPVQVAENFVPHAINDVSWHRNGSAYALATEQGQVWLQDLRAPQVSINTVNVDASSSRSLSSSRSGLTPFTGSEAKSHFVEQVHVRRMRKQQAGSDIAGDCLCVAFDPLHDFRLVSGGCDGIINVLDMRDLSEPVEQLDIHAGSVTALAWSHSLPGLLASAGEDGVVFLFDANKMSNTAAFAGHRHQHQGVCNAPQGLGLPPSRHTALYSKPIQQLGLPGLSFIHAGHLGPVGALALNPDRPFLMATSANSVVDAEDSDGELVTIQEQPLMVWEPNVSQGLLC